MRAAEMFLMFAMACVIAVASGCDGIGPSELPAPATVTACGAVGGPCCDPAADANPRVPTCSGELYCDTDATFGPALRCVAIRGAYGRPCHVDGSCDSPALECMSNVAIAHMCILPQAPATCGNPGQPCCRTLERDGTLAKPCQGKDNHSCQDWCRSGATCDGSHRNSADNVCVVL